MPWQFPPSDGRPAAQAYSYVHERGDGTVHRPTSQPYWIANAVIRAHHTLVTCLACTPDRLAGKGIRSDWYRSVTSDAVLMVGQVPPRMVVMITAHAGLGKHEYRQIAPKSGHSRNASTRSTAPARRQSTPPREQQDPATTKSNLCRIVAHNISGTLLGVSLPVIRLLVCLSGL
jgi:hypothetical protein